MSGEQDNPADAVDLLAVGGGINGAAIARDAVGRGLSVLLVEQDDLANHTSSASTKLIHGGLRYLEYGEVRLVREALMERERLLRIAPHLIYPLRFVLPQTRSPRPAWMVRLGLFLYDHIGGRSSLPKTRTIALATSPLGDGLSDRTGKAFVYSDGWVDDSRLVVLTARDAFERGARVHTRTRFVAAQREGDVWVATLDGSGPATIRARAIVNAAGPWVADVIGRIAGGRADASVRLVKGSHIVVPRLYDGDHALMLQNPDRRIVFAIPYEGDFTLVGTTDEPWTRPPGPATIDAAETRYLLETIARYFNRPVAETDIVWSYSGIRPLYDDHAKTAAAVTRDYVLDVEGAEGEPPVLSVFGGKITTHRKLAEHALDQLRPWFADVGGRWTDEAPLPGGDMPDADFARFLATMTAAYPKLPPEQLYRMARAYGTRLPTILGDARYNVDPGIDFGGGLSAREVDHMIAAEWAVTAEDVLFRRSKIGLHVTPGQRATLSNYMIAAMQERGRLLHK
ncbi:glycerol-3-phosphate dehydrogenase [Sphingomonas sp. RS2018]